MEATMTKSEEIKVNLRKDRNFGWGYSTNPKLGGGIEAPDEPTFKGTIKTLQEKINNDPVYQSLRNTTHHNSLIFYKGKPIKSVYRNAYVGHEKGCKNEDGDILNCDCDCVQTKTAWFITGLQDLLEMLEHYDEAEVLIKVAG